MTLTKMISEEIVDNNYAKNIDYADIENSFNVATDEFGNYYFNLNTTIVIEPGTEYKLYDLKQDLAWPLVSYKLYGTTRAAWILMKINEVKFEDVFKPVKSGTKIKYLDTNQIQMIANTMSNLD